MNIIQKDKTISNILYLFTLVVMLIFFIGSDTANYFENNSSSDFFSKLLNDYFDYLILFYTFVCFQIAGYVELKYKRDFITLSLSSILFTPLSLFFIVKNGKIKG